MTDALLVVDVQAGVFEDIGSPAGFVERIAGLVEGARTAGVPVFWVQHADETMPIGSPAWMLAPGLEPRGDEVVVQKEHRSAFAETGLGHSLRAAGVSRVLLTGAQSSFCVDMAGKHALVEGFDVALVSDAHADGDLETSDGVVPGAAVTALINRTWSSLLHPGRTVEVIASDALDWA